MKKNDLLLANGFIPAPEGVPTVQQKSWTDWAASDDSRALGTVLANLAHFGFAPSAAALESLRGMSKDGLETFWEDLKPSLRALTGADRDMGRFVVYKNFPREVLDKSESDYWIAQILMYMGVPNEIFAEAPKKRSKKVEVTKLKVLDLEGPETLETIWTRLAKNSSRWTDPQKDQARFLFEALRRNSISADMFAFKENAVLMAAPLLTTVSVEFSTATDAMRLAAALSGGDISLRERVRFKTFSRPERRALLDIIAQSTNLKEDFARRPEEWKRLLRALRPGDWAKYASISNAYNGLYSGALKTHAALVELSLSSADEIALDLLEQRPGDFLRRFHNAYSIYRSEAVDRLIGILDKLSTSQLLKFDGYVATVNHRDHMIYPPKGNWTRAKVVPNKKVKIDPNDLSRLRSSISAVIKSRLDAKFPEGFDVDAMVGQVKLQTNDQKLAPYGRGTAFPIPEEMTFIRSASFWQSPSSHNIWYDNGWNFFSDQWSPMGACSWDNNHAVAGATFSGDPTNSKDLKGRACQMIDLDLDMLEQQGIRYAVWSILCYSRESFDQAVEVLGTLQWGQEAQSGRLFEPSRAQMVFPIKGANLTKFIAYIDVKERTLVYIDANLKGSVASASANSALLSQTMRAYAEYLACLPTVGDLFSHGTKGSIPVVYSDEDREISGKAFVFTRRNEANTVEQIDLSSVLTD